MPFKALLFFSLISIRPKIKRGFAEVSGLILNVLADILYKANGVFKRAIDAIIHFGTEQHQSFFAPSEAADIKSVMQGYGETTEQQKCGRSMALWLCGEPTAL